MDRKRFVDSARKAFGIADEQERRLQDRVKEVQKLPRAIEVPPTFEVNLWGDRFDHEENCGGSSTTVVVHSMERVLVARAYSADEVEMHKLVLHCVGCGVFGDNLLDEREVEGETRMEWAERIARQAFLRAFMADQLELIAKRTLPDDSR